MTEGRIQVTRWLGDDESLRAAAAIEADINHPLARAIVLFAQSQLTGPIGVAAEVQQAVGRGVTGVVQGKRFAIGNRGFLEDSGHSLDGEPAQVVDQIESSAASPVFVLCDDFPVAVFGVSDPIRSSAKNVVSGLQRDGWKVVLLSGDRQETAFAVGQQLGISRDRVHGELLPDQKLAAIGAARCDGAVVMVGDGVNDAAALAAADVGVAVRGGASASLAASPVMIASGELDGVLQLIRGAKTTRRTIIRNFAVSLTYNLLAVVLAIAGFITPLLAAVLMPISSISVLAMTLSSRLPRAESG